MVLSQQGWAFSSRSKSISIKEFYHILFYHLKKPLYYLYHTILQYLQHPKNLFLLKYYFLIFLYYFFPTVTFFFQNLAWINFPWLSNSIFFPQSPSTSSIGSTHKATHTDPDERIKEIRYKTQTTTYNQRQPGKPTSNEWTHIPIQEMKEAHIAKYQNQSKNTKLYS